MRSTLRDPELEAAYERDGYVTLPLLDEHEVATLRSLFVDLGTPEGDPERVGTFNTWTTFDRRYKHAVNEGIRAVLVPHLATLFDRQRTLPPNFLVKYPGDQGELQLHQDTNLVDETEHRSAEVWVALEDMDAGNGQLWMTPGSQSWVPAIRGINAWFRSPFAGLEARIMDRHSVPVPMRAGEATVFNHATLHFSRANTTARPRMAAIIDVIPEEARHVHYFDNDDGTVDVFEVDESFWMENDPATIGIRHGTARPVATVADDAPPLTPAGLDALVRAGRAIDTTRCDRRRLEPMAPRGRRAGWRRLISVRLRSPRPAGR